MDSDCESECSEIDWDLLNDNDLLDKMASGLSKGNYLILVTNKYIILLNYFDSSSRKKSVMFINLLLYISSQVNQATGLTLAFLLDLIESQEKSFTSLKVPI